MSNFNESKVNRQSAGKSTGGQFAHKQHDADDSVGLGTPAPQEQPAEIPVIQTISWSQYGVMLPRKRKPRNIHHTEEVRIPIKNVSSEDAPLAAGEYRYFDGSFYKPDNWRRNAAGSSELQHREDVREQDRPDWRDGNDPVIARQEEIDKASQRLQDEMIFIDGQAYNKTGEPHYVVDQSPFRGYHFASISDTTPDSTSENVVRADRIDEKLAELGWDEERLLDGRIEIHDPSLLGREVLEPVVIDYQEPDWRMEDTEAWSRETIEAMNKQAPRTKNEDGNEVIDFRRMTYDQQTHYKRAMSNLIESGAILELR